MKLNRFEKVTIGAGIGVFWPLFWLVALYLTATKHKYANLSMVLAAIMTVAYFYTIIFHPEIYVDGKYGTNY